MVVTATGMQTQMGQIATMLTSVTRTRSPLQQELDSLTKVLGIIAWTAVAFIVVVGLARGDDVQRRCSCSAPRWRSRRSRPGMPAFVSGLLSLGAKQLADAKAVVKNLTDVETLGATSAINTDKTGTLTMNEMMVSVVYANGVWFTVEGEGYRKTGAITSVAGRPGARLHPARARAGARQRRDRRRRRRAWSATRPRPRSSCWRPSSASTPRRPAAPTRALAEVPFDSDYKFMATFHRVDVGRRASASIELVKGGPTSCSRAAASRAGRSAGRRCRSTRRAADIDAANERMGEQGLRVLAFAARLRRRRRAGRDGATTRCR